MEGRENRIIGVDFDNTIADYDGLMHGLALERQWVSQEVAAEKKAIRDHIRSLDEGEIKWQKLQALAYGKHMARARLIDGVTEFIAACREQGVAVYIISHKTQFAAQDEEHIDLHQAALAWIKDNGLGQNRVFFEPTRQKKVERVISLGCTLFIDDLVETFLVENFPRNVQKVLYAPHDHFCEHQGILVKSSWEEIHECFITGIRK